MNIRLTTFNCENLFGRYRFLDKPSVSDTSARSTLNYTNSIQVYDVVALEGRSNRVKPKPITHVQRVNTAGAILGATPDILCVNEVENLATLRIFNALYLKNYFERMVLIDGNDPRGIDVGVLIKRGLKVDLEQVRSHADDAFPRGWLPGSNRLSTAVLGAATFSRDCLEVDLKVGTHSLTLLLNHLKAQSVDRKTKRDTSTDRRRKQAKQVADIVAEARKRGRLPVVLGDMNKDIRDPAYDGSLDPLVTSGALYDPFPDFMPSNEVWSHYYSGDRKVSRLDYILVDSSLNQAVKGAEYFRLGLTPKCKQYAGLRLVTLTKDGEEASDHCPTTVVLNL
jgi:endonuclease/exonuclease/phosphatase family metal-dependent hydrolase